MCPVRTVNKVSVALGCEKIKHEFKNDNKNLNKERKIEGTSALYTFVNTYVFVNLPFFHIMFIF